MSLHLGFSKHFRPALGAGLIWSALAAGLLSPGGARAGGMDKFLALGTSSTSGVYYPVGKGICRLLNAGRDRHLTRCFAYATGGSIYNIQAIRSGELDLAITRADLAYQAFKGSGVFATSGPNPSLRAIAALYDNPFAILVSTKSGIEDFEKLPGSRINIGNLGSGKRDAADLLFKIKRWSAKDFKQVTQLSTSKMGAAFCAGRLDVLIQVMGIPAGFYGRMVRRCGAKFIDLPGDVIAEIKEVGPFFEDAKIPGGLYPSNPKDVRTVGVKSVLISEARLHAKSIGQVARSIFHDLAIFKKTHAALKFARPANMLKQGVFIPFHDGAKAYYRSRGLLK